MTQSRVWRSSQSDEGLRLIWSEDRRANREIFGQVTDGEPERAIKTIHASDLHREECATPTADSEII